MRADCVTTGVFQIYCSPGRPRSALMKCGTLFYAYCQPQIADRCRPFESFLICFHSARMTKGKDTAFFFEYFITFDDFLSVDQTDPMTSIAINYFTTRAL